MRSRGGVQRWAVGGGPAMIEFVVVVLLAVLLPVAGLCLLIGCAMFWDWLDQ